MKERFVGEGLKPAPGTFATAAMANGRPGLPTAFTWRRRSLAVQEILEEWTECGDCRHGSGERYLRKHWFRIRTPDGWEMKLYFERQPRSSGGSRWRLYSVVEPEDDDKPVPGPAPGTA